MTVTAAAVGALTVAPLAAAVDIDMRDIDGTATDDVLIGTSKRDRIWAGGGFNRVFGKGGNDRLFGGTGRDEIYAAGGDDLLRTGAGRDLLVPSKGYDRVSAGPGRDVIRLRADGRRDVIDCGGGRDVVRRSTRAESVDSLVGCERVVRVN
ncbi:hypothetical protein BH20ACT6_BH20ACT6_16340 [soil metagenome]